MLGALRTDVGFYQVVEYKPLLYRFLESDGVLPCNRIKTVGGVVARQDIHVATLNQCHQLCVAFFLWPGHQSIDQRAVMCIKNMMGVGG